MKHKKIIVISVAAAACLLLLAFAFPIAKYVAETVSSFAADRGSGTTEEISNEPDTEEVPYLQFSPDLEPISQDLVDEINEKFFAHYFDYTYTLQDYYRDKGEEAEDAFNISWRVIRNYDCSSPYLGTIGDYVIFIAFAFADLPMFNEIDGYDFEVHTYVYCIETKTMCRLSEAYENRMLKDTDIELLSKRRQEFFDFAEANKDIPRRITKNEYYNKYKGE